MNSPSEASAEAVKKTTEAAEAIERARIAHLEEFRKSMQDYIPEDLRALPAEFNEHKETDSEEFLKAEKRDIGMDEKLDGIIRRLDPEHKDYILKPYVPMLDAYQGIVFSQKFFTGVVSIVVSIATFGGVIYGIISWVNHR